MSRRYAAPIRVELAPAEGLAPHERPPQAFVVRCPRYRRYRVVAVLARWVEAGAWWRGAVPVTGTVPAGAVQGGATPGGSESFDRVVWRVEARSLTGSGGVYDLSHDVGHDQPLSAREPGAAPDRWFLVRAMD